MNKISFEYIPEHNRCHEIEDCESFFHSIPDYIILRKMYLLTRRKN
jgi:hypothetical protein